MRIARQFSYQVTRHLCFKDRTFSLRANSHEWHFNRKYRLVMSIIQLPRFFESRHDFAELSRVNEHTPDLFLRCIDGYSTFKSHCLPPTRKEATFFPSTQKTTIFHLF